MLSWAGWSTRRDDAKLKTMTEMIHSKRSSRRKMSLGYHVGSKSGGLGMHALHRGGVERGGLTLFFPDPDCLVRGVKALGT